MDEEKTDPGAGNAGLFCITGEAFVKKTARVREISDYLNELKNPLERRAAFWRLADAVKEMLEIGADFHRAISAIVAEQPVIELEDVTPL